MASAVLNYNSIEWEKLVYYDESSESKLRWKIDPQWNKKFKDNCVGYRKVRKSTGQPLGWIMRYGGINYQLARVLYIVKTGIYLPNDFVIDHLNGDCFDNTFSNLRAVPEILNSRNKKKSITNTSGKTGIRLHYTKSGTLVYIAGWITNDGKHRSKSFNTEKYGENSFDMAVSYRLGQIDGLGYSERHTGVSDEE